MIHITPEVDMAILDLIDSFKTQGAYLAPNQEPPMGIALRALEATIRAYGDARAAQERKRCQAVCWAESKRWRALERDAETDFNRHYADASALTAERIAAALANADQPGA